MTPHTVMRPARLPAPSAVLELLKPITWFAPVWAFGCGLVSSGVPVGQRWSVVLAGLLLAWGIWHMPELRDLRLRLAD